MLEQLDKLLQLNDLPGGQWRLPAWAAFPMTRMMGQDGASGSLGMTQSWGCGTCTEGDSAIKGDLRLEKCAGISQSPAAGQR